MNAMRLWQMTCTLAFCALWGVAAGALEVTSETLYPIRSGDSVAFEQLYWFGGATESYCIAHFYAPTTSGATMTVKPGNGYEQIIRDTTALGTVASDGYTASPYEPILPATLSDAAPVSIDYTMSYGSSNEGQTGLSAPYAMRRTFTLMGQETVSVPGGTFACYKVRRVTTTLSTGYTVEATLWYAPDVGMIRMEQELDALTDSNGFFTGFPAMQTSEFVGGRLGGIHYPANAAGGALMLDQVSVTQGAEVTLSVSLFGDQPVDVYLGYFDPYDQPYSILQTGAQAGITPYIRGLTLATIQLMNLNAMDLTTLNIDPDAATGHYVFFMAMMKPDTFNADGLCSFSRNTFFIYPR